MTVWIQLYFEDYLEDHSVKNHFVEIQKVDHFVETTYGVFYLWCQTPHFQSMVSKTSSPGGGGDPEELWDEKTDWGVVRC